LRIYCASIPFRLELDGNTQWIHRARRISAIGIFAVALALTFASFDWFMSLEYHWFSTMFGVWFFASSMRAAVAFRHHSVLVPFDTGISQGSLPTGASVRPWDPASGIHHFLGLHCVFADVPDLSGEYS
jgi:hypothetical protein